MRSPGSFTSGELTFEAGDTIVLNHCKVWNCSENIPHPKPYFMTGLFTLDEYQCVDRSAGAWEAGWFVYPVGDWPTVVDGDTIEPIIVSMTEGLALFVSMDDLWPNLDPKGYGQMLENERLMEMWGEMEMEECNG